MVTSSCSYSLTSLKNPWEKDGIKTVSVPVFKNQTMEGGAEVDFSNSLRLYLTSRSGKLKYVTGSADARIEGEVQKITLNPASIQFGTEQTEIQGGLPKDRLLAVSYTLYATVADHDTKQGPKALEVVPLRSQKHEEWSIYRPKKNIKYIHKRKCKRETIRSLQIP